MENKVKLTVDKVDVVLDFSLSQKLFIDVFVLLTSTLTHTHTGQHGHTSYFTHTHTHTAGSLSVYISESFPLISRLFLIFVLNYANK